MTNSKPALEVAYADKTRVVLATPKTRAEQWPEFWGALQTTLQEEPEFTGIDFSDVAIRNLWSRPPRQTPFCQ